MTSDWRRWQHALIARHAFGLFASVAWAFAAEGFDLLRWQPSVLAALASVAMGFDVVVARAVTRIARAGPPLGIARAATFAAWAQVAFGAVAAVLLVVEQLGIASPSAYLREAEGFVFVAAAVTGVDLELDVLGCHFLGG